MLLVVINVGKCVTNRIRMKIFQPSGRAYANLRRNGYVSLVRIVQKRTEERILYRKKNFDRLNRKFKRQFQRQERQKLGDKLNETNQRDFWKSIGNLGIANNRKRCIPLAVVDEDGNEATDKNVVLNKWKNDFQTLFHHNGNSDSDLDESTFNTEVYVSPLISREEVLQAVLRAKLRKAAGIDDIPVEVLKNDTAVNLLFQIISGCFNIGRVLTQWTSGIINPILKQGTDDERQPLNYRGITLISVRGKIYCNILNHRLSTWLEKNNVLCDEQNGFRRGRSCEEHIHSLYSVLNDRKISRKSTYVQPFIISCTMGMRVMLAVIFVSVLPLAVSRSPEFKRLVEKNLKRQFSCSYDQYVCSDDNITCASHCNSINDCNNGEDEMFCGCSDPSQWHCDDGIECATSCDGTATCPNGEDEKWCGCSDPSQWHCDDGIECATSCDGTATCPNGEDEKWCGCSDPNQGHCDDGASCGTYCDGSVDCPSGEDEQWCGCSDPLQMQCMDGSCATWCDGHPECSDDEDEMWCDMNMYSCSDPMQSTCNDGSTCAYWCDGSRECADGEDEMWCGDMYYASSTHNPSDVSICGNGLVSIDDICIGYETYSSVASHDFCRDYYYAYGYMKKKVTTRSMGKTPSNKDLKSRAYQIVRARHDKKRNDHKMKQAKRDPHMSDKRHGNVALESRKQTYQKKINDRKTMQKKKSMQKKEFMQKKEDKGKLGNLKYLLTARRNEALKQRILKKLGGST
ncbi:unnamed protein product [Mytilus coruscus]|uniref:Reverse transcriptase domain-containing protein n=1 Tax=Mytilus coruscus TaxID=42192 RepID=A0A6J8E1B8_MYTCO|nr:unnamed protein product [Mytilus coruscus]